MARSLCVLLSAVPIAAGCSSAEPAPTVSHGSGAATGHAGPVGHGGIREQDASPHDAPCGGRADIYTAGMSRTGPSGWTFRLVEADPTPPALTINRWMVAVMDGAGAPVEGATVVAEPLMVDHGHGTNLAVLVREAGDGMYELDQIAFIMPGYWTVEISATRGEGSDAALFGFCIDGPS